MKPVDPNTLAAEKQTRKTATPRMSVGDPVQGPKTSGVKTRGNGAAKRGVTARGPMA